MLWHQRHTVGYGVTDPYWSSVVCLVQPGGDNSLADRSLSAKTITQNGSISVSGGLATFSGTQSLFLGASADSDFDASTAVMTFEEIVVQSTMTGWTFNLNDNNGDGGGSNFWIGVRSTDKLGGDFNFPTSASLTGSTAMSTGVTYHRAFVITGSQVLLYLNGVSQGTGTISGSLTMTNRRMVWGRYNSGSSFFQGTLSGLRVTRGVNRYPSAGFTPPTSFPVG